MNCLLASSPPSYIYRCIYIVGVNNKDSEFYFLKEKREMEKYDVVKHLGAGNFGVARLLRHKETKELVAMKYIERGHKV